MKNKLRTCLLIPFLIAVFWTAGTSFGLINSFFLPPPVAVTRELIKMLTAGNLLVDTAWTLTRTTIGFAIACCIGIPLGLFMGYSQNVYDEFEFTINFFRNIPATALFPLFMIFFGIGEEAKIATAAWVATLTLVINSTAGVRSCKKLRLQAARIMKPNNWTLFSKVIIPETLPQIFIGARVAYSLAFIVVIVAEMSVGTNFGLGKRIIDSQLIYKTTELYATILITGLLGFTINQVFLFAERKIIFWQGK